jgi:hypothetical protein
MTVEAGPKDFEIEVNNREVTVTKRDLTGAEILTAAGLDASLFQLFLLQGEGNQRQIGAQETVKVHPHERFSATRGDDGS